ncbi:MAG TPA: poly-beta-hydroxybutyrate-responsive repressor [Chloroflexota bacterium]|jgi:poly-beta-hydroxybutyrate-responsive repressor|nr:poly-beta-hydroxybutyrate-responsive repressor [Chloroflexota bacterium]
MNESANPTPDLGRMPKNFLSSWLLLLLRNWNAHGYQLIQTLTAMGLGIVDPPTVYRALRQLEEEGLISSAWDATATGPARRVYTLSEAGEQYLGLWANQLGQYQTVLARFFDLYNGAGTAGSTAPEATATKES